MSLSSIYSADPDFTYNVGGYTDDAHKCEYTRTFTDIFSDNDFDTSILTAGNIDCDMLQFINASHFQHMMDIASTSSATYKQMIDDPSFDGYDQCKLLGTVLIQTNNWSSFSVFNLSQMRAVIGGDISAGRFFLGTKEGGLNNIVSTAQVTHEPVPPVPVSGLTRYSLTFQSSGSLEDIENKVISDAHFGIRYYTRTENNNNVPFLTFDSNYAPILAVVISYDSEIYICSLPSIIGRVSSGLSTAYNNGAEITFAPGKMNEADFELMTSNTDRPSYILRPALGNVPENTTGMISELYVTASRWYMYYKYLACGAIVRRLLTISGIYFLWEGFSGSALLKTVFDANIALGTRNNYGLIEQDGYNRGYTSIKENDPYFDKLNYIDLPDVDPDPPAGDDDKEIDMDIGLGFTAGGMINYYHITAAKLDELAEALSNADIVPTGKDVLPNLISLKAFPLSADLILRGVSREVIIAGVHTTVNAVKIDATYEMLNLGSIEIEGKYNNYLDYAPYTSIDIYLPFCGWVHLPDTCMNKTISAFLMYDIVTGGCTAVVKANKTVVAQAAGNMASDMPFTAQAVGSKWAGLINGMVGLGSSAVSLVGGIAAGSATGMAAGTVGLAGSISNLVLNNNKNWTEVTGRTGDQSEFGLMKRCILKIMRPISAEPDNYKHTVGYMCNKTKTLNECSGFTVCSNVDTSGISRATDKERAEIKNMLESGVFI